jgi:hypothetical protein
VPSDEHPKFSQAPSLFSQTTYATMHAISALGVMTKVIDKESTSHPCELSRDALKRAPTTCPRRASPRVVVTKGLSILIGPWSSRPT